MSVSWRWRVEPSVTWLDTSQISTLTSKLLSQIAGMLGKPASIATLFVTFLALTTAKLAQKDDTHPLAALALLA